MNELFFIPGAICSIITVGLYNIKKRGNKLVLLLIILLCLSNLVLWTIYNNAAGWDRLGYGILAYTFAVSLLSLLLTLILQRQMNKLYVIIMIANILIFILSIITIGLSKPESNIIQSIMYINSISGSINVIYNYVKKIIWRNVNEQQMFNGCD